MSKSYENLDIWKNGTDFATLVYKVTLDFPKSEQFGITSQLRRAVVSAPLNIAEGSSRTSKKDYARFIEIAIGSLNEVVSLLVISKNLDYLTVQKYEEMKEAALGIGRSLGAFKKYLLK
ncbi:MAG: four helix bundle protein [Candidatus Pacebacteria bacterium]|nr:four helix bundle protein [Candidatus Paceibacterota bacterium]